MMDHALRSISYIADIGDLLVIMARRRLVPPGSNATPSAGAGNTTDGNTPNTTSGATTTGPVTTSTSTSSSSVIPASSASALSAACDDVQVIGTTPKMICHVFESEEVCIEKCSYVNLQIYVICIHIYIFYSICWLKLC